MLSKPHAQPEERAEVDCPRCGHLTADDFRNAATACEAQGNIHDGRQVERDGISLVNATWGRGWHDLAAKFVRAMWVKAKC